MGCGTTIVKHFGIVIELENGIILNTFNSLICAL